MRKVIIGITLALSGCAGIRPPQSGGFYDIVTFEGARSYCSSLSEQKKLDVFPVIEFASMIDDERLLNEMTDPSGVLTIFSGWYRGVWIAIGNRLQGRVENADEWLSTAKRLMRISVNGCKDGLKDGA